MPLPKQITSLEDIISNEPETPLYTPQDIENMLDPDNLEATILEFTLPLDIRIRALEKCIHLYGDEIFELIYKLANLYSFSGISLLEEFLYESCLHANIPFNYKLIMTKSLLEDSREKGYNALYTICQGMSTEIPTPVRVETILILMEYGALLPNMTKTDKDDKDRTTAEGEESPPPPLPSSEFLENMKKYDNSAEVYFVSVINDNNIECSFRYKCILGLEKLKTPSKTRFLTTCCKYFLENTQNMVSYRILSAQYLLQRCNLPNTELVEQYLLSFAQDEGLDYNVRADASDVLLGLGSKNSKRIAMDIILTLGNAYGKARTIFENAQNVHVKEFDKSVLEALEFLNTIKIPTSITYESIKRYITEEIMDKERRNTDKEYAEECKLVEVALERIHLDRALYSKYNCTLVNILSRVWAYLLKHKNEDEMKVRLYQELLDMAGTCSTGFASRLVNVIAGFGDFNFRISWEDQIVSNFSGRLTAKVKTITNNWNNEECIDLVAQNVLRMSPELVDELADKYDKLVYDEVVSQLIGEGLINGEMDDEKINNIMKEYKGEKRVPEIVQTINPGGKELSITILAKLFLLDMDNSYTRELNIVDISKEDYIQHLLEDFQQNVMAEMCIDSSKYNERKNFLTFFRETMLEIREEMYEEFKSHIDDEEFDLAFRRAIEIYEGAM